MTRLALVLLSACSAAPEAASVARPPPAVDPPPLRGPEAFADIADPTARAAAIFREASRVLLHPRCTNCHPSDDSPRQRDGELHDPPVVRGPDDRGVPGLACATCHQDANLPMSRVPGAPNWHLAPKSMAWIGATPASLCAQIKDPARNGGRSLAKIVEHAAHDPLVAWGFNPGHDRTPVPGSQAQLGALVQAWVSAGAGCPGDEGRP